MKIYPVKTDENYYGNKKVSNKHQLSFSGSFPHSEITKVGDEFIKRSINAKNRKEFYIIAKSYLKDGLIPILEKKNNLHNDNNVNGFRQEVVNMIASDIELSFDPQLMSLQENTKHVGLKDERKHFKDIVKTVNKLIEKWKEDNNIV